MAIIVVVACVIVLFVWIIRFVDKTDVTGKCSMAVNFIALFLGRVHGHHRVCMNL